MNLLFQQNQNMKSRCSSAPRMQQVYTSRIKDGRRSNDFPRKQFNMTAPRFAAVNSQNPETQKSDKKVQAKPSHQQMQKLIEKKISVDTHQPPAQLQVQKNTKETANNPRQAKQQTIHGRKLQFPAEKKISNPKFVPENSMTESVELMRYSSLSSKHFVNRSIKSANIKQRKAEFDQKFKLAFGYLLDNNQAYLNERRRACNQKARPKDQNFKVKRPNITTTNKDQYFEKNTPYEQHMEAQNLKTANSFGPRKVCGNSTTQEFHKGLQGPRADLQEWPDSFKLQGPLFGVTTYANKFPNHGDFDKMVPIATFNEHPLGMPHRTNSTHRTFFKGQKANASDLATWNNLHPYGNDFDPLRGTTYSQQHNQKQQQSIQQWPMYDPQLIKSDGKFTTEHKSNLIDFTQHELNNENYCSCNRKKHLH